MKNSLKEIFFSVVLIILAVMLLNPFDWFMGNMALMLIVAGLLVIFGFFVSFIWREKAVDERDSKNQMFSGRLAFLSGALVLLVGIIVGAFKHQVDPWLIVALAVMMVVKLVARIYSDRNC